MRYGNGRVRVFTATLRHWRMSPKLQPVSLGAHVWIPPPSTSRRSVTTTAGRSLRGSASLCWRASRSRIDVEIFSRFFAASVDKSVRQGPKRKGTRPRWCSRVFDYVRRSFERADIERADNVGGPGVQLGSWVAY